MSTSISYNQFGTRSGGSAPSKLPSRRDFAVTGALAVLAVASAPSGAFASSTASAATNQVLDRHLGAFAKGLDTIMADYSKESVLLTHDKIHRGLSEIREFFDGFLKGVTPGFWEAFKITARSVEGEIAYLVWEAKPFIGIATDTFLVRKNKIVVQTFTAG